MVNLDPVDAISTMKVMNEMFVVYSAFNHVSDPVNLTATSECDGQGPAEGLPSCDLPKAGSRNLGFFGQRR